MYKPGQSGNPAGKPKGAKDTKPRKPRVTSALARALVAEQGFDPLAYLLSVARDNPDIGVRIEAAKACLPYIHPRLNATDLHTSGTKAFVVEWVDATQAQDAPPPGGLDPPAPAGDE